MPPAPSWACSRNSPMVRGSFADSGSIPAPNAAVPPCQQAEITRNARKVLVLAGITVIALLAIAYWSGVRTRAPPRVLCLAGELAQVEVERQHVHRGLPEEAEVTARGV